MPFKNLAKRINMKTVGIIGGLGPEATTKFYLEVISGCTKSNQRDHPSILIYSVPLPLKLEKECILDAQNEEKCIPYLLNAAKILEKGGADFIVMPCNSLHLFIEEIRRAVKIPVLSIVEETIKHLNNNKIKAVGVLATSITINNGLYQNQLEANGIKNINPDELYQTELSKIIYKLVIDDYTEADKDMFNDISGNLIRKGAKSIILACTDLQLLSPFNDKVKFIDTMQVLVDTTIRELEK